MVIRVIRVAYTTKRAAHTEFRLMSALFGHWPFSKPLNNSAFFLIVHAQFNFHLIAGNYPDKIHAHSARKMSENLAALIGLDFKKRAGQRLYHLACFDDFFLMLRHAFYIKWS